MITILGPTACGKTQLAVALAAHIDGAVVSADSRQVYKGMDIGTGKDLNDYIYKGVAIPAYLIDICQPGEQYNVYRYQKDFYDVYTKLTQQQQPVILCGGSGLYIEAIVKQYQMPDVPQNQKLREQLQGKSLNELTLLLTQLKEQNGTHMHNITDVDTPQRAIRAIEIECYRADTRLQETESGNESTNIPPISMLPISNTVIGVHIDREQRRQRITQRLHQRLKEGMVEEVRHLLDTQCTPQQLIYYGLEYKYITEYITGKLNYDDMVSQLEIAIHQFAKRQMTWFRGMERRGTHINWIDFNIPTEEKINTIFRLTCKQ